MSPQIVVVGSYAQDLAWRGERFPAPGETVVGSFFSGPGGKGSNQAVAASRAGVPTVFVGAVGRDAFATEARRFYRANGIGARLIVKPRHATGTAGIFVNAEGQNEIVISPGANAVLSRRDIDPRLIDHARVVVTQLESNPATSAHVLKAAARVRAIAVLNPAPMRADFDLKMLRHADVLIPNETEFAALVNRIGATGRKGFTAHELASLSPEDLHALCGRLGVPVVIITLGARGCFVSRSIGYTAIPAFGVKSADTSGAGDAFVGDLERDAWFANAVAALSTTKPGTAVSMPTEKQIAAFLRRSRS